MVRALDMQGVAGSIQYCPPYRKSTDYCDNLFFVSFDIIKLKIYNIKVISWKSQIWD